MKTRKLFTAVIAFLAFAVTAIAQTGMVAPPPSFECEDPANLTVIGITKNTADLSWTSSCELISWEIEVIPATGAPTGMGVVYNGALPYVASGLIPATEYVYYVRLLYGIWIGPYQFETSPIFTNTQNLCTKTIQPYNVNVGDATHYGSTYAWSISPAALNAVISGNGTNAITIDWTNVPDGSYMLQAIETSVEGFVSTAVSANINLSATPAPTAQPQTFCDTATVANLVATGTDVKWYASANDEAALDSTITLVTGTYYVSQTLGTCDSITTEVEISITIPNALTIAPQTFCGAVTVSNLVATGENIKWYASANEVAALEYSTALATTTYYASQTVGTCESTRTAVAVSINAPQITANASTVCSGTAVNLTISSSSSPSTSNSIINYSRIIGNELYVSPNGADTPSNGTFNSPFKTIQYAINSAQNNQIITLKNGIYYGVGNRNINLLGKKLIIQSENGPYATIMDCEQSERGFNINQGETNETIIQGITIKNGKTLSSPVGYGSAIFVEDNSSISIKNCVFESNLEGSLQFGDTEVSGGQSFVTSCIFRNNLKSQVNSSKKTVTVESCLFENNISLPGEICGNGHASYSPSYYKNCIFRNNQADIIVGLGHAKSLVNCLLYNNTTTYGTVYMGTCWSGINVVNHCTFYNNTCNYYDSHWYDHIGQVYNSIFSGPNSNARNHVSGNQGAISYFSSREGDPSFIDASNGNFNLAPSSNCIANANDGQNIGVDFIELPNFNTNSTYFWSTVENSATINPTPTATTTYWCDVTTNGITCRKEITISVTPKTTPTFTQVAAVCSGATIAALPTTSTNAVTGTWSPAINNLATTTYTFMPTAGLCANTATMTIIVNPLATAPTATASQTFCASPAPTVASLTSSGTAIQWYAAANGGTALASTAALVTGTTYYASQTIGTCESARTSVAVSINDPQITANATTVCAGTAVSLIVNSINSTSNLSPTWELLIPSSQFDGNNLNFSETGYNRNQNLIYSLNGNYSTIFNLNTNTVNTSTLSNAGAASPFTYDFTNNRLIYGRSGRDNLYAIPANGGSVFQIGNGSFDSESYGGRYFWNPTNQKTGLFGGYGFYAVKNWIWENNGSWANPFPNNSNCNASTPAKRNGQFALGAPNSNKLYLFSGQGSCDGNQLASSCSLGSPWATDVGVYCWLKDLWELDLQTYSFKNILPVNNSSITREGSFVYDYVSNTFYVIGGYIPSSTYNRNNGNLIDYETNILQFKVGVDSGFLPFNVLGTPPPTVKLNNLGASGTYYDALNNQLVWMRKDGIWGIKLSQSTLSTYLWSTGETTATINPTPTATTTYWCDVTTNGVTCRKEITITVTPKATPTFTQVAAVCSGATIAALPTTSTNAVTGTWSPAINNMATTTYTFTPTAGLCANTATMTITVNPTTAAPTASASQTFCASPAPTIASLTATGTAIQWYAALTGGTAFASSIALVTATTYYVSQTIGTCESIKTAVEITITPQVTPTFTPIASTCSGFNITALPTTSNNGITRTWSPAINNNVTTTYTFTPNEGQCAATTTQTIIITTPLITSEITFVAPPITVVPSPSVPTGNQNYSNRKFMIFNVSELNSIDFSTVLETSAQTVRISVDGTKTFVKWDGEMPQCVINLTTKEGPYSYEEILTILSTPAWSAPMQY